MFRDHTATLRLACVLALSAAGCGEERMVSRYVPKPPPPPDVKLDVSFAYAPGKTSSAGNIRLPRGKTFQFSGQISGVPSDAKLAGGPVFTMHPHGKPNHYYGACRLQTERLADGTVEYTGSVREPFSKSGEFELWFIVADEKQPTVVPITVTD